MSDLEGVILSDYLLLRCISRGGVADVYRARQNGEGDYEVAVKVFRPGYAQRASFREYFMNEAEKIGQLDHPNILPFLEYGEGDGLLYVVTPFIANGTLDDLLRRVGGRLSSMQALPILQQLCSAVQYAHEHDVIHGNIKPTNVFVANDGRMLLSDFGIAHTYDDSQQSLTRVGWGSAEYAAPEQSLGVVRRSSDIYSLGVLLFRILTGSPPFTGHTPVEVLLKHVRQTPPSARSLVPNISDAVDEVLRKALQKRSDDRYASAAELGHALLEAVTVAPVASPVARTIPLSGPLPLLEHSPLQVPNPSTSQLGLTASSHANNPQTPFPMPSRSLITSPLKDIALLPYEPPSPPTPPVEASQTALPLARPQREEQGSTFLEEGQKGSHVLWSEDPPEWSPIAQRKAHADAQNIPLTASEYLSSSPQGSEKESAAETSAARDEVATTKQADDRLNRRFKKILPIIVVILLLIGLLGALLSAFFFPSDNSSTHLGVFAVLFLSTQSYKEVRLIKRGRG